MEDSQIIDLLNKRDETAVTALMDKYGGLCRGLIGNVLTDRRDIEECLNGVMFRLWSAIPPARPENLMAYAAKTARNENECFSVFRTGGTELTAEEAAAIYKAGLAALPED